MKHLIPEFEKMRARYPKGFESSLVLPCLRRIQEDRGFVADEDIDDVVAYLGIPRIQVEEVLSFYGQFRRKPIGRCHLQVCRNLSCSLMGAERILDHLTERLGIAPGQTTADGRFTFLPIVCLGACDHAPVMMIDEDTHLDLASEKINVLLKAVP